MALEALAAILAESVLLRITVLELLIAYSAPPEANAELLLKVELTIDNWPADSLEIAPPLALAIFARNVLRAIVIWPRLVMAPPSRDWPGLPATLALNIVSLMMVVAPAELYSA